MNISKLGVVAPKSPAFDTDGLAPAKRIGTGTTEQPIPGGSSNSGASAPVDSFERAPSASPFAAGIGSRGNRTNLLETLFIILKESAQEANADKKAILQKVQHFNEAKKAMREIVGEFRGIEINKLLGGAVAHTSRGFGIELQNGAATVTWPSGRELKLSADRHDIGTGAGNRAALPVAEAFQAAGALDAAMEALRGRLDSIADQSGPATLRIQMAMDRTSAFLTALTNLCKKTNDTSSSIVQNLK